MLLELFDELGVAASDGVMIGDTEYDMHMANNAGTAALAVSYGVHEKQRLLACQPLACVDNVPAIRRFFADMPATDKCNREEQS